MTTLLAIAARFEEVKAEHARRIPVPLVERFEYVHGRFYLDGVLVGARDETTGYTALYVQRGLATRPDFEWVEIGALTLAEAHERIKALGREEIAFRARIAA